MSPRGPVRWLHKLGLRRPRPEQSVAWEIEHHIAELSDRLVESGWDEAEARGEAERRFGDPQRYGLSMRRMERGRMAMERRGQWWDMVREWSASVGRTTRRYPGFTLGVTVTMALGIGANATMYGIVDRLLLQPPDHIVDPDRVMRVFGERPHFITGEMTVGSTLTYPDYADLEEHSGLRVAAYTSVSAATIGNGATASRAEAALATAELFPLLGVTPVVGRFYTAQEGAAGSPLTAVIGADYWERAYANDPEVLGRSIEVDGRQHAIIGVAPSGFTGLDLARVDLWLPLEATHAAERGERHCLERRGCWWLSIVSRLNEDATVESAQDEATALHINGRRDLIDEGRYSERARIALGPVVAARGPEASDEAHVAGWLVGVSVVVLLIACANVANLLLARGSRRRKEIALRCALGAPRRRVVGYLVMESVLLAAMGGVLALVVAVGGGAIVRSALLPGVLFPNAGVTPRLLAFTGVAALLAGLIAGVAPALHGGRTDLTGSLAASGRGYSGRRSRLRAFLTVSQASMSVVLLVGAGLFLKSLAEVRALDLGLDVDRLVLATLEFTDPELSGEEQAALYEEALRRVADVPGVQSAAATGVPFQWALAVRLEVPGLDSIPRLPGGGPYHYPISPGYFGTVGLTVQRGRPIEATDGPGAARVAVVSATMAATLWPDLDPLGQCLIIGSGTEECSTVVGVVEDASRGNIQGEPFMAYYVPADAAEMPYRGMYVRASGDAEDLLGEVAPLLRSFSPLVRYADVRSLRKAVAPQARAWTLGATMFSVFGLLAMTLAAIGLYSVLTFDVAQRTRELGIRSALGAEKARLLRSVLARGARLGVIGVVLGAGAAYLAAPWVRDLLFQTSPRDPRVFTVVAVALVLVSIVASLVPGMRATQVDAMEALRAE